MELFRENSSWVKAVRHRCLHVSKYASHPCVENLSLLLVNIAWQNFQCMLIKIDGHFVCYFLKIMVVSSIELSWRFKWFCYANQKEVTRKLKLCYSCLNYDKNKDVLTETMQPLHPIRTMPVLSSSVGNKMCFSSTFFSSGGTALIHGRIYFGNSG